MDLLSSPDSLRASTEEGASEPITPATTVQRGGPGTGSTLSPSATPFRPRCHRNVGYGPVPLGLAGPLSLHSVVQAYSEAPVQVAPQDAPIEYPHKLNNTGLAPTPGLHYFELQVKEDGSDMEAIVRMMPGFAHATMMVKVGAGAEGAAFGKHGKASYSMQFFFDDQRQAAHATGDALEYQTRSDAMKIVKIKPEQFKGISIVRQIPHPCLEFEACVSVNVYHPSVEHFGPALFEKIVYPWMINFGPVLKFQYSAEFNVHSTRFFVEFFHVSAAEEILVHFNRYGKMVYKGNYTISITEWLPDGVLVRDWFPFGNIPYKGTMSWVAHDPKASKMNDLYIPELALPGPLTIHRVPPNHNTVRIENVRSGHDVRTTLMIRNIPNAMTLMQLKALLDRIIPGKYDFLYLRMDFRSRQNVGYAFINLQSAVFIEDLYVIHGRTWTVGMPSMTTKVCMLCYATIQGRDGLIENFRNSAVMLEWAWHRPKLYYTDWSPVGPGKVGKEEEFDVHEGVVTHFPGWTNRTKLMRSQHMASTVGLFSPRSRRGVPRNTNNL